MNNIKEIRIQNFKGFPLEDFLEIDGKNLLLFGENGSGKSSLYWALYTFLQSSEKNDAGVNKYFEDYDPNNESTFQSLLNIHSTENSFIKLKFEDDSEIELSKNNGANTRIRHIVEANLASDFITYKLLYNFYGSTHKDHLDVWTVFRRDIFPFFFYSGANYDKHYSAFYTNLPKDPTTGYYYRRNSGQYQDYQTKITNFNAELDRLLGNITQQANLVLKDYLDIDNIAVILSYDKKLQWDTNKNRSFTKPKIKFHIKIKKNGVFIDQHRPHSFLNEAILSQLSLAIRLGALFTRLAQSDTKILVLDDLLISLDMDNREKILDILLQRTLKNGSPNKFNDFQIFFFTHDRGFHYFVGEKIKQHKRENDWIFKEIYAGIYNDTTNGKSYPKPILIDGYMDDLEKAKMYLTIDKDYTASALYIRKALEKTITDRLPKELVYTIKGEQRGLNKLWEEFVNCYTIPQDKKDLLNQSRLMILNPQSHYNFLSLPVFHAELNRAIELVEFIQNNISYTKPIILLSKGMQLAFQHPAEQYTFKTELLGDFYLNGNNNPATLTYPKCKILSWKYNNTDFWDFRTNTKSTEPDIARLLAREDKLSDIFQNLESIPNLGINKNMIKDNTHIENGVWTLKEVLDKVGVSL